MHSQTARLVTVAIIIGVLAPSAYRVHAEGPGPHLSVIDPPGGRAGTSVEVQIQATGLEGVASLVLDDPRIIAVPRGEGRFLVSIPSEMPCGIYDLRAQGTNGVSSPRPFFVGPNSIIREIAPGRDEPEVQAVDLNGSLCGRIEPAGDVDSFRFRARAGQRVVVEVWSERLDSRLRAVLELEDERGRRLASSRGHVGFDPLIDVRIPADGDYVVRLFDLTYTGSSEHFYRLDIDTGPRVETAWPIVVERGTTTRVTLFGRNLPGGRAEPPALDRIDVDVTPPLHSESELTRTMERPSQCVLDSFQLDVAGDSSPVLMGVTDVPVFLDASDNHAPATAQALSWPCEVSGRLEAGDETDWYRLRVDRGDVVWLELLGERIGAPVDLELSLLDAVGRREILRMSDSLDAPRSGAVSLSHSDPTGRWVAPTTGDYLVVVRNVIGGTHFDPRRAYRLAVRREEADFQLLAVPGGGLAPGGWNVPRGGRAWIDLIAIRRRGLTQPIRVTAPDLPDGLECPEVWIGPDVDRVPVIVTSRADTSREAGVIRLVGHADLGAVAVARNARVASVVSSGNPHPSARLTGRLVMAAGPEALCLVTATPSRTDVSQGAVIDVSVALDVASGWSPGPVTLTGMGIPADPTERVTPLASETNRWWLSFQVPERLSPGPYSFAIRAETVVTSPPSNPGGKARTQAITAFSNPITIQVEPGAIDLRLDRGAPRTIKRGDVVQLQYRALRRHGFIGKIHTELDAPGGVKGLRARGVTFVGQTETGVLQIAASDDAPIGLQPALRLEAVGTVEDEPVHHVGCFIDLEITP